MIASAVQKNKIVLVYNEKGKLIFSKIGKLNNVTPFNISIQHKGQLLIYDAKGKLKYTRNL